ncbi:DUF1592 domain-containing protein [Tuwongella immobilis]|uniref:Cytochrome c domain-containing protein n=1 Tax=Tuwongella immobilis TaxID=692036 RepID=A0A6C2YM22_9BACT|nr:DUF1592 domain-containing protein [Tuwongella immobilis]VIP02414.1 protein containing duf1592 : Uncharacterized protein OS=Pirellula staleyi (strain ATCC 27377 / DSM 6068 / ICPB 4128) GN=Psta_1489 PE=4 SV=1: PSD3: PSD5: PSD4: PSCyt3: PSD2 [Tuwongella immobilis]VTS01327.1 protein containing duf1592 : Uncharacterized protein OS=Pirellula staleyi (strain ATCC 27377 / DSM 6068 / ICPB 4128) GN=Psta_1489 PE=4 SV=1: PSD3: PSD5: PSD4: PSCyt3: PSD2 [Tuwongella immobilis]
MRRMMLSLGTLLLSVPICNAAETAVPADLARDGLKFVQQYCMSCHNDKARKADLSLEPDRDEAAILRNRKVWQNVLDQVQSGAMPPSNRPQPKIHETEAFVKSIRGVFDRYDRNAPPDPGRVTVRRLNRTEYRNTVRDLLDADFDPTENFPADDIGHGFDNIGDVLTVSPVLMERYLAAAESVLDRAILVNPPKPSHRQQWAPYTEPAGGGGPKLVDGFRVLTDPKSPVNTPFSSALPGEFLFKARVYGESSDATPVRVAMLINGKEYRQLDVKATKAKPEEIELKAELPAGEYRVAIGILNPGDDKVKRSVMIQWLSLTGPMDMRPLAQRKLLAVTPGRSQREQTIDVMTRFLRRAYRRPPTIEEINRSVELVEAVVAEKEPWVAGIKLAMQAALVSPKFLFRLELDDRADSKTPSKLDEFALASRLSYFLWASMPDDELLTLAEKGQLSASLDAQVNRMLADPRSESLVENFALQWLQLQRIATFQADQKLFPHFSDELRKSMLKETQLFVQAIFRENRSVLELIDSDFTFLNEKLSYHYGIEDTMGNRFGQKEKKPGGQRIKGEEFVRVKLQPEASRGGLLTMASVLSVTSNPTRTSPVKRGRWVLEQILGTPPPPAPPDVPELQEGKQLTGTLRQRMEQHRANPSCAGCHARMDPLGFAFENFDATGKYRWQDEGQNIDSSGVLPDGRKFQGPNELKKILLAQRELIVRNLVSKMLTYALGRGVEYYDKPAMDRIVAAMGKEQDSVHAMIRAIVQSEPFRMRRGRGQGE